MNFPFLCHCHVENGSRSVLEPRANTYGPTTPGLVPSFYFAQTANPPVPRKDTPLDLRLDFHISAPGHSAVEVARPGPPERVAPIFRH